MGQQVPKSVGNIPSIFDLPTSARPGKAQLGKRPGGPVRVNDNKKPNLGVSLLALKVTCKSKFNCSEVYLIFH